VLNIILEINSNLPPNGTDPLAKAIPVHPEEAFKSSLFISETRL
jgi:hypothetical protein